VLDLVVGADHCPEQIAPADDAHQPPVVEHGDAAQPLVDEQPRDVGDVRRRIDGPDVTGHHPAAYLADVSGPTVTT
jgi:hypothetical protein